LHRPPNQRPLESFESLIGMTVLYIVGIAIISFFMKDRRQTEYHLKEQGEKLKRANEEVEQLRKKNIDNSQSVEISFLMDSVQSLTKKHQEEKAKYKPLNINPITIPHNFIMCIYSFYAWIGIWLVLYQNLKKENFNLSLLICDPNHKIMEGLSFWTYTFYLSKFVEYLDTVFLLLKAKPVMPPENSQYLLHIYHHAITAAIVWVTIHFHFSTAWTGPLTNAGVHTLMYGYYFLAEMDKIDRTWGGKFITPIQLVQFLFCLLMVIYEVIFPEVCGSHVGTLLFLVGNYVIFFTLFVKIWLDKKRERRRARAEKQLLTQKKEN